MRGDLDGVTSGADVTREEGNGTRRVGVSAALPDSTGWLHNCDGSCRYVRPRAYWASSQRRRSAGSDSVQAAAATAGGAVPAGRGDVSVGVDLAGYYLITGWNRIREEEGLAPIPMPSYLVEEVQEARRPVELQDPLEESLLAS